MGSRGNECRAQPFFGFYEEQWFAQQKTLRSVNTGSAQSIQFAFGFYALSHNDGVDACREMHHPDNHGLFCLVCVDIPHQTDIELEYVRLQTQRVDKA